MPHAFKKRLGAGGLVLPSVLSRGGNETNVNDSFQNPESNGAADLAAAILKLNESVEILNNLIRSSIGAKPVYSAKDLALLLGKSEDSIYKLGRQMPNPLPLRELKGAKRGKYVTHDEFMAWFELATRLVSRNLGN